MLKNDCRNIMKTYMKNVCDCFTNTSKHKAEPTAEDTFRNLQNYANDNDFLFSYC